MWKEISQAEYIDGYRIVVVFNDGIKKVMDFSDVVDQYTVFRPLKDINLFKNFKVTDTLEWNEGEIDIAPEYIFEHSVPI